MDKFTDTVTIIRSNLVYYGEGKLPVSEGLGIVAVCLGILNIAIFVLHILLDYLALIVCSLLFIT